MKKRINVTVLAMYPLVGSCLESLLKNEKEINITGMAGSPAELIEKISRNQPDVVMLCLMKDEINNLDIIPETILHNPGIRFVLLIEPGKHYDQMAALKMGFAGIVEMNQTPRVLIGAVKQVYLGGTWFSQKIITRLMDGDVSSKNGKNETCIKPDGLTKREYEIIDVILLGKSNREISKKLFISEATVRHHLSSIYSKLYLNDRLNLVIYALQNDLSRRGQIKE